jgi:hypothetical protein
LIPGARSLGFETTYLADTYAHALPYLNDNAPRGATVYVQAGTYPVAETYRRIGGLREDLRPAYLSPIAPERNEFDEEPRPGSYFLFLPRQSIYTEQMISLRRTEEPLFAYEKGGVPLVEVYSGEAVGRTLGVEGTPEPRSLGFANALAAGAIPLAALLLLGRNLLRGKQQEKEQRRE